ncbi:MAG: hypothetical protein ABI165_07840 [Bryobacteraceae bacterium]
MRARLLSLVLAGSLALTAQMRMTVEQLVSFVRSAVELKQPDVKLAAYLKKVKLADRLDDRRIEELQGMGAGPKTVAELRALRDASATLTAAAGASSQPAYQPRPAPAEADRKALLAETTGYALNYSNQLPDFFCTQVTRRFDDPTGTGFRPLDTIVEKLTYFDHREDYKVVLVNNQPKDVSHENLGGATSAGEFGSMMREIFEPQTQTHFEWEKWTTLRGRLMQVFSYRVEQPRSRFRIVVPDAHLEMIAGYHGLVYVDNENHMIARITKIADDVPASFPVQDLSEDLNYDYQSISGRRFLLPLVAEIRSREGKLLVKNNVEFHMYRKFGTDTSITFDTPAPVSGDQLKEQPPAP